MVTAGCLTGYTYVTRNQPVQQRAQKPVDGADTRSTLMPPLATALQPATAVPPAATDESIARWAADAFADDPQARAVALAALAHAPGTQAIPILERVLNVGSVEDRQLALNSLQTLAQQQGDDNGLVRAALRQAIYHSDSDTTSSAAQLSLDAVEHDLAASASDGPR
jgi:hypothetical protein